jgi:hypothetical protein
MAWMEVGSHWSVVVAAVATPRRRRRGVGVREWYMSRGYDALGSGSSYWGA